jgi:hypothetical protein
MSILLGGLTRNVTLIFYGYIDLQFKRHDFCFAILLNKTGKPLSYKIIENISLDVG